MVVFGCDGDVCRRITFLKFPLIVQHVVERPAGDELHGEVMQPRLLSHAMDRHDVGVMQPRGRPRLALEPLEAAGIEQAVGRQHLQGDVAMKRTLFGLVDDSHPAPTELAQDAIIAQLPHYRPSRRYVASEVERGQFAGWHFQEIAQLLVLRSSVSMRAQSTTPSPQASAR